MSSVAYLIVEQQQPAPEELTELLRDLVQRHRLDGYQCRQRLLGQGLSLLTKGPPEFLEKVSTSLTRVRYRHWLVAATRPGFAPRLIRGLQITPERILFRGRQEEEIPFPAGCRILAIFADLSGALREQSVKQLLSSHAYRGRDRIRHIGDDKIHRTILQGRPVLDLYRLDEERRIAAAVRILPGKFAPQGLGNRATLSSRQNLRQILQLAEEYAGDFTLYTDFGLVNLPGCGLHNNTPEAPETLRRNLISLTRYGWLMTDVARSDMRGTAAPEEVSPESGAPVGTVLPGPGSHPVTGATEPDEAALTAEISGAAEPASASASTGEQTEKNSDGWLPPPPAAAARAPWRHPGFWLGGAGALLAVPLILLSELETGQQLKRLTGQAFASGAVPALGALLCFLYGFVFLRLRRRMADTPTSRIRSLAMGMVEVKGRALRQYALVSPMARVPCVYYRLTRYRRQGRERQWKVSSISTSNNVPFAVEDATGRVSVDPAGGRVRAVARHEGTPAGMGWSSRGDNDEKWVEEVITDGTLLYVLGYASVKRTAGPNLRERKIAALRTLKRDDERLARFDADGDGRISQDEWENARRTTEDDVLREHLKSSSKRKKQEEHIVIGKKAGHPLVISETHSEAHLAGRYLAYSCALFAASGLAIGGAIYLLLNFMA